MEPVILLPTDDMYTDPDNTAGQVITQLWTANFQPSGNFQRIMMRFDLEPYYGMELESAVLSLTRFYSCPAGGTTASYFYRIKESWDENTWDFRSHIGYDPMTNMPFVFSGNGGNAIVNFDIDVTDFLQIWLTEELDNYGFLIMSNSGQKFSKFHSKESSVEAYRPYLSLEFSSTSASEETVELPVLTARNYPNPFNPTTTIAYSLPSDSNVRVSIYNSKGQFVDLLFEYFLKKGDYQHNWDGLDRKNNSVPSGIYYFRIETDQEMLAKPMVLIK
jgi:hypothetical protein